MTDHANFKVILKKEKQKIYNFISWIILSVNFICLFLISSSTGFKNIAPSVYGSIAILSAILIRYLKPADKKITFVAPFLVCAIGWVTLHFWWIAIIDLIFMLLSFEAIKDFIVFFSENEIKYSSSFRRNVPWVQVSNVILKDDILTIDLKNNKIIQQQVDERSSSINEKEFNDFCNKQLAISNQKKSN